MFRRAKVRLVGQRRHEDQGVVGVVVKHAQLAAVEEGGRDDFAVEVEGVLRRLRRLGIS